MDIYIAYATLNLTYGTDETTSYQTYVTKVTQLNQQQPNYTTTRAKLDQAWLTIQAHQQTQQQLQPYQQPYQQQLQPYQQPYQQTQQQLQPYQQPYQQPSPDVLSILSFVFGLLSFGFWIVTGIPAIILGIISLKKQRNNPNTGGKTFAILGIVFGGIVTAITVVMITITLLVAISVPSNYETNKNYPQTITTTKQQKNPRA